MEHLGNRPTSALFPAVLILRSTKLRGGGGASSSRARAPWFTVCIYMVAIAGSEMFPYARSRRCISCRPCRFTVYIYSVCQCVCQIIPCCRDRAHAVCSQWGLRWVGTRYPSTTSKYTQYLEPGSRRCVVDLILSGRPVRAVQAVSQDGLAIIPVGDCLWA